MAEAVFKTGVCSAHVHDQNFARWWLKVGSGKRGCAFGEPTAPAACRRLTSLRCVPPLHWPGSRARTAVPAQLPPWRAPRCCCPQERLYHPDYQNFPVKDKQEDAVLEARGVGCGVPPARTQCGWAATTPPVHAGAIVGPAVHRGNPPFPSLFKQLFDLMYERNHVFLRQRWMGALRCTHRRQPAAAHGWGAAGAWEAGRSRGARRAPPRLPAAAVALPCCRPRQLRSPSTSPIAAPCCPCCRVHDDAGSIRLAGHPDAAVRRAAHGHFGDRDCQWWQRAAVGLDTGSAWP